MICTFPCELKERSDSRAVLQAVVLYKAKPLDVADFMHYQQIKRFA